ncbi:MAG: hypothetical protein ACKVJU_24320 [Verrucomicrobiales bacterium]
MLDIDSGLFGFEKEFTGATDAKGVIGCFDGIADFDGIFVDDVFVLIGVSGTVVDVPTKGFPKEIEVFAANFGFVVVLRFVVVDVLGEFFLQSPAR